MGSSPCSGNVLKVPRGGKIASIFDRKGSGKKTNERTEEDARGGKGDLQSGCKGRKGSGDDRRLGDPGRWRDSRWFSMQLTRRNAPWAFLKGEPFRNISSLELMAVLVAVVFFGDNPEKFRMRGAMRISGTTDNLGNCYVLQRLLSCKFPLSIVVMELACQLERLGLELDLAWAPRNQNVEADALTNSEYQGFDPKKRILKELEEIEFVLLHELLEEAAEMNEELKMARSSKEAKGDRPEKEERIKKRKGQTRWEDPCFIHKQKEQSRRYCYQFV